MSNRRPGQRRTVRDGPRTAIPPAYKPGWGLRRRDSAGDDWVYVLDCARAVEGFPDRSTTQRSRTRFLPSWSERRCTAWSERYSWNSMILKLLDTLVELPNGVRCTSTR
jgi:hypothetical protein